MKVVCVRFNSGEEIIAKVSENFSDTAILNDNGPWEAKGRITLDTVLGITFQQVGPNQMGIAFVPWAVGNTEATHIIDLSVHAFSIYPPSVEIERSFLEQTSGIQLAKAPAPKIRMS
jgi:hypothetical protein